MAKLVPSQEIEAADWIVAALRTFAESVLSLVPEGFSSYVRVFHPAYRFDRQSPELWETRTRLRWAEVAAANGTRPHPGMQWLALTRGYEFLHRAQPGVYDYPPREGSLPDELVRPLTAVLRRHTAAAERCWFAVWNGFGGGMREDIRSAATFRVPGRDYFLLRGPIGAISESALSHAHYYQSVNIWWPDDRAWCVATEIDLDTTYIGCSEACRDNFLAERELEALEVDPASGITYTSDTINPTPPRPIGGKHS